MEGGAALKIQMEHVKKLYFWIVNARECNFYLKHLLIKCNYQSYNEFETSFHSDLNMDLYL